MTTDPLVGNGALSLTPARQELARITAELAARKAEHDSAERLLDRATGPNSELAQVGAQLAELRAQSQAAREAWNAAGCPGDPPVEPADLVTLERARANLRQQLGADDAILQAAEGTKQRSREQLATLSIQQQEAHGRAALEAVCERLELSRQARMLALNELAFMQAIAKVLENRRDPVSVAQARAIDEKIKVERLTYAVRGDMEAAARFLEDLLLDPAASIPDPGAPLIEVHDPIMLRPPEDGLQHLNRAPEAQIRSVVSLDPGPQNSTSEPGTALQGAPPSTHEAPWWQSGPYGAFPRSE